jgi:hypothetical protein
MVLERLQLFPGPSVVPCPIASARDEEARGVTVCPCVDFGVEVCPRVEPRPVLGDPSTGALADVLDLRWQSRR